MLELASQAMNRLAGVQMDRQTHELTDETDYSIPDFKKQQHKNVDIICQNFTK